MARSIYAQNLLNLSRLDPATSGEAVRSGLLTDAFRQLEAKKQKRTEEESTRRFDLQFGLSEKGLQDQIASRERAFQLNLRQFQQQFFERGAGTPDERGSFLESLGFSTPPTDIGVGGFGGGGGPGAGGLAELIRLQQEIKPFSTVDARNPTLFNPQLSNLSRTLGDRISGFSGGGRRTFGAKGRGRLPNFSSTGSSPFTSLNIRPTLN